MQEARIRANRLPDGYPQGTQYQCHSSTLPTELDEKDDRSQHKTIRGLMNVLDEPSYRLAREAGLGSHQNALWTLLATDQFDLYCANAYFQENEKDPNEVDDTLKYVLQSLEHIEAKAPKAWIIIGTDLNYDPFKKKGVNKRVLDAESPSATCS